MIKIAIQSIACILLILVNNDAKSLTFTETYCNDKAQRGKWEAGVITKRVVDNIVDEFDLEYTTLVSYLDKLPVQSTELYVLNGIKVTPQSTLKIGKINRFQWDILGKKSHLNIILKFYEECIYEISLMESNKMIFYNRSNIFSTHP